MGAYEALAASYDRLTNDVDYEATVDFYYEILKQERLNPRTAVDLACGTGSVTAILAKKGLQVIGIDMSEEMLTVASQKAGDLDPMPWFICQSLQEMRLPRAVDMAVCALDSLDYITDPEDCQEAIRRTYKYLNPGGIFIFDVNTPESSVPWTARCFWMRMMMSTASGGEILTRKPISAPMVWICSREREISGSVLLRSTGNMPTLQSSW